MNAYQFDNPEIKTRTLGIPARKTCGGRVRSWLDGMKLVLFIIFVAVASYIHAASRFAGPFNVQVKEPFVCDDEGSKEVYFNETTVRKKSKNFYAVTTKIHLKRNLDDELGLKLNFAVWGNGGWRPNFLTMDYRKACTSFMTLLPGVFKDVMEANNLTGCPVPMGEYAVVDADASPQVGMTSLPYNKYKIYISVLTNTGDTQGCLGMIAHIVPKERKKG